MVKRTSRVALVLIAAGLVAMSGCSRLPGVPGVPPTQSSLLPTRTLAPNRTVPPVTPQPSRTPLPATTSEATPSEEVAPAVTGAPRALSMPTCAAAKLAAPSVSAPASASPGVIAFIGLDGNIAYTDGSAAPQPITTDAQAVGEQLFHRLYKYPTFSADGKTLAFVEFTQISGTQILTQTLRVAPVKPRAAVSRLYTTTEDNIPYVDWSPDGQLLAFVTINSDSGGTLRLAQPASGKLSAVDTGNSIYWNWRRDSAQLLAHMNGSASRNDGARLTVVDAGSRRLTQLKSLPGNFRSPQYSPDGKFMLFVQINGEGDELVVADAAGKPLCALAPIDAGAVFSWSPDGRRIAWIDAALTEFQPAPLVIFDLTTGETTTLNNNAIACFWSPDGKRLAVYSITDAGTPVTFGEAASTPAAGAGEPALRIEIVDVTTAASVHVADTLPTDEFMQTIIGYFDQYSRGMTPWSPDSTRLVFATLLRSGDGAGVAIAAINKSGTGVTLKRIAAGVMAFWSPR
jgi:Tol biopolymer transport system component